MATTRSESVPAAMKSRYDEIVALTDAFCKEKLNDEYAQVCRWMVAALARKRVSPLNGGRIGTWAAGIVHAVSTANFAFDRTQTPHIKVDDLADYYGLSKSTIGNKSKEVRDVLKIGVMDPDWTLPSLLHKNPMVWYISVNGFMLDARFAPREIQEEAFRLGLIPYIPADHRE